MTNVNTPPQPESIADKIAKLKERKRALHKQDMLAFYEAASQHARMVESKYKEQGKIARQYKAFHALINSTVEDDTEQPYYDFPEPEYSVEKFIEKMEREFAEKKTIK